MGIEHTETIAGKFKIYKDKDATDHNMKMGYKGTSYMGGRAICVPKDGDNQLVDPQKQMVDPRDGDKFIVEDCMFGDVFTVKAFRMLEPNPDGSISISRHKEKSKGPPNAVMGVSDRGVGTSLKKDPERGWIAEGYWYCPHVPPEVDLHESESKRLGVDTKALIERWKGTKLMDGLDPNSQEAITTAVMLDQQLCLGHGTCGGWGC